MENGDFVIVFLCNMSIAFLYCDFCVDVCIRIIDFLCRDVVSMCFLYVFCADVSVHYDFVCWICVGVSP